MIRPRRHKRKARGAAAVEFAFVLPILLLLLLGSMEFGRAFMTYSAIADALTLTGRYATCNASASSSQLQTYFGQVLSTIPASSVALTFSNSATGTTTFTTISASYKFNAVSSYLPFSTITLGSSVRVPRLS
ncbi:MAG: pilus assembly protein [Alphaproteobacteria bacterium]|nr:pilus assembly protein [Alphaproteobacteria bacterium]MBV8549613.1 pilus assembly protein [Alphaproteobacteria bacterium]